MEEVTDEVMTEEVKELVIKKFFSFVDGGGIRDESEEDKLRRIA